VLKQAKSGWFESVLYYLTGGFIVAKVKDANPMQTARIATMRLMTQPPVFFKYLVGFYVYWSEWLGPQYLA
jgi:hypothetical protein